MTRKDKRSRELVAYRKLAHRCAVKLQSAMKTFNIAAKESEEQRVLGHFDNLCGSAGLDLWWLCGGNPKNLSKALHDVALALSGKLRSKNEKLDTALIKAVTRADREMRKRKRGKGYEVGLSPETAKVYALLKTECEKIGVTPTPTNFAAKRRLKILGYR